LLAKTSSDSEALTSLALAYAGLNSREREALAAAVFEDSHDPRDVLAAFLAVEEDLDLAARLAGLLSLRFGRPAAAVAEANLRGDDSEGEVELIRPLHGSFVEVMRIIWNHSKIDRIAIEPVVHSRDLRSSPRVPVRTAVDCVAPLLWRYARAGNEMPPGADRFAVLFSRE
jgi:hypothetical protein